MRSIVFFDVDDVLVNGQTQKLLIHFLFKKKKISFFLFIKIYFWFVLYGINLIKDTLEIRKKASAALKNWDVLETDKLLEDFFRIEIRPRVFNQSIKIIYQHINQNHEVVLVSASLFEIVDKLRNFLSLKFAISTKLEKINNKYTGKIIGEVPYGKNKVKEVRHFIKDNGFSLEGSYAYGDHFSDLPLLQMVTYPIVINPDTKLRRIAKVQKWIIYDFK